MWSFLLDHWPLAVPDLIYTLVMFEYLFLWLRKIQHDIKSRSTRGCDGWGGIGLAIME